MPLFSRLIRLKNLLGVSHVQLTWAMVLVFVTAMSTAMSPWLIGWVIDVATRPVSGVSLSVVLGVVIFAETVRIGATYVEQRFLGRVGAQALARLRERLTAHLLGLPLATTNSHASGALVTRITNDVTTLSALFTSEFVHVTERLLIVCGVVVTLMVTDLQLAMICLVLLGLFLVLASKTSPVLAFWSRKAREEVAHLNGYVGELIDGARSIRSFGAAAWCHLKAMEFTNLYRQAEFNSARAFAVLHPSVTVMNGIGIATLLIVGGKRIAEGSLTMGALTTFVAAFVWFFWPILHVLSQWQTFVMGMVAVDRLSELFCWPQEERWDLNTARPAAQQVQEIKVTDLHFGYTRERATIKGISFSVSRGQFLGLVGPSGAGKSTLVNLLAGLNEPDSGTITFDGQDTRRLPLRSHRSLIGVVDQEPFLFGRSLDENLSLGSWPATQYTEMRRTLESISPLLAARINQLDQQQIGERGTLLSAGERQLVSLARTVLQNPAVLILDEATSSFDPALEGVLLDLLSGWGRERIVIAIAHRLRLVEPADQILVLFEGQIVERGRHEELVGAGGLYKMMWELDGAGAASV